MHKLWVGISQFLIVAAGLMHCPAITSAQVDNSTAARTRTWSGASPRPRPETPNEPGGVYDPGSLSRIAPSSFATRATVVSTSARNIMGFIFSRLYLQLQRHNCPASRVKEIDETHDVRLMASTFCIGVRGRVVTVGQPLELQVCDDASPAQRFALDGDAIMMGTQSSGRVSRNFVIEPQFDRTPSHTPLVVGTQEVSDAEYFRFEAVDHSSAFPTTGFVRSLHRGLAGLGSQPWLGNRYRDRPSAAAGAEGTVDQAVSRWRHTSWLSQVHLSRSRATHVRGFR